ncbi:MAG: cation:proton antiporter [Saccharofermentanales bacterium]|jgi:Kef-type K+ transport system membrane component KefB
MHRHVLTFTQFATGVPAAVIPTALMLLIGFAMTRFTKRARLPNVTAYIVAGILIGPHVLDWVPSSFIEQTEFLTDVALAFIAFSVGEHLTTETLKKDGRASIVITLTESLMASALVFVLTYVLLGMDLTFSLILAALSSATAPASTMMTIRQTRAEGDYVNTLLQVIAMDDIVALTAYSVAIAVAASVSHTESSPVRTVLIPLALNVAFIGLGALFAWVLKLLTPDRRSTDNRLIIAIALLLLFNGLSAAVDVSPLLGCMTMGIVYANIGGHTSLFKQLNYFSPPILLLFFVRSGVTFDLHALTSRSHLGAHPLWLVGVLYFIVRLIGKYAGAYVGSALVRKPKHIRRYLGLALAPQAGVAIGLAAMGARMLGPELGVPFQTIILASSVLYELIGPASAKLGLYLAGAYTASTPTTAKKEDAPSEDPPTTASDVPGSCTLHDPACASHSIQPLKR